MSFECKTLFQMTLLNPQLETPQPYPLISPVHGMDKVMANLFRHQVPKVCTRARMPKLQGTRAHVQQTPEGQLAGRRYTCACSRHPKTSWPVGDQASQHWQL
uniref:Uncharacterized protein n=1 Tax=Micrurus spixii TaxID=129469 RepID=A0A2D4M8C5_9SAUR